MSSRHRLPDWIEIAWRRAIRSDDTSLSLVNNKMEGDPGRGRFIRNDWC